MRHDGRRHPGRTAGPDAPGRAASRAAAIETSTGNQSHCRSVTVDILTDELAPELAGGSADYAELGDRCMDVENVVDYRGSGALAATAMDDGYPLMEVVSVPE